LVGTKLALAWAVRNNQVAQRHTTLAERIRAGLVDEPNEGVIL
jgi:hypothetical protein